MRVMQKENVIYPDLPYQINGILFKVRKELGQYRNEKQYCDAIEAELNTAKIKFTREHRSEPSFANEQVGRSRPDFVIEDKVILEVKSKSFITKQDYYQVKRYLEAYNKKLAVLVNMRRYYINPKRILNSQFTENGSQNSHTIS